MHPAYEKQRYIVSHLALIGWAHTQNDACWSCKYAKITVIGVPINNYELLNMQAYSLFKFWNRSCTQSLVVSSKNSVVPLISTRVPGYTQVILFSTYLMLLGPKYKFRPIKKHHCLHKDDQQATPPWHRFDAGQAEQARVTHSMHRRSKMWPLMDNKIARLHTLCLTLNLSAVLLSWQPAISI